MLFFWMYSLASLLLLIMAKIFFVIAIDLRSIVFGWCIFLLLPLCIPLVGTIRSDLTPTRPLWTTSGVIGILILLILLLGGYSFLHLTPGTLLFFAILFVGAYFALDSRIFFAGALLGLGITVISLLVGLAPYAEQASVYVYLLLVLGVLTELMSPWFGRLHHSSHRLLTLSESFISSYRRDMEQYVRMISLVFAMLFVTLVIGRGRWFRAVEDEFYVYISLGVLAFFVLALFLIRKPYTLEQFFSGESGLSIHLPRFLTRDRVLWIDAFVATLLASYGLIYGLPIGYIIGMTLVVLVAVVFAVYGTSSLLSYVRKI